MPLNLSNPKVVGTKENGSIKKRYLQIINENKNECRVVNKIGDPQEYIEVGIFSSTKKEGKNAKCSSFEQKRIYPCKEGYKKIKTQSGNTFCKHKIDGNTYDPNLSNNNYDGGSKKKRSTKKKTSTTKKSLSKKKSTTKKRTTKK